MYVIKKNEPKIKKSVTVAFPELSEDAFVTLKTLPYDSIIELKTLFDDDSLINRAHFFRDKLASVVIEHNFYSDESTKMSNDEVIAFLYDDWELMTKFIKDYTNFLFFTPVIAKDSTS